MFEFNYKRFTALTSAFVLCLGCAVFGANNTSKGTVNVRIESYDKTIAEGSVTADVFIEAVQLLGEESGIPIVIGMNSTSSEIYSVDGIVNKKFGSNDGWFGYVDRNGSIFKESNFLKTQLNNGDNVVLYYGNKNDTKIISNLKEEISENKITLKASSAYVQWSTKDGKTVSENIVENLKTIRIHMKTPDGFEQVVNTDNNGRAVFTADKTGYYIYYAEGYNTGASPTVVKTEHNSILMGIEDENEITRGEFTSLMVNNKNIKGGSKKLYLLDIKNLKYSSEIEKAVSSGIISGYADNTFRPSNKISVLEAAVILSRFYTASKQYDETENIPQWAVQSIGMARDMGILDGVTESFESNVSINVINKMLENMK